MSEDILNQRASDIRKRFSEIRHGVNVIVKDIRSFLDELNPHIRYFFSDMNSSEGFYFEVIVTSEKDMKDAMERAISNMNGDVSVHERSREALMKTMELKEGVGSIIELLEYIEIFSLNTMVISAKAGMAGQALSTISVEMARLSRLGSELSAEISGKMLSLEESINGFDRLKEKIEFMHENNLTRLTLSSSSVFTSLDRNIRGISGEVLGNYAMIEAVTESLKSVFEKFQYEDIVRQGFEKVLFARDCESSDKDIVLSRTGEPDRETIKKMFGALSSFKLEDIVTDITTLFDELTKAFGEVIQSLDVFTGSLNATVSRQSSADQNGSSIDAVNIKLVELKNNYESYVSDILSKKEEMLSYLLNAEKELDDFSRFFDQMLDISGKFKTIILLTHIEIARHQELNTLLSGALNDVRNIPIRINLVVDNIYARYESIRASIRDAIADYRKMLGEQKHILGKSIILMNTVISKMDDAQTRHSAFVDGSAHNISGLRDFIGKSLILADEAKLMAHGLSEYDSASKAVTADRNSFIQSYSELAAPLIENLTEGEGIEKYELMMLISLIREYFGNNDLSKVELF